jgi:lycopene cyclase domain-containing protein
MTYLVLNVLFLLTLVFFLPRRLHKPSKVWWGTLAIVMALTAVFDPVLVALDIVAYDPTKILGLTLFGAPVEDFFYAIYAVAIVPLVWKFLEVRDAKRR